MDDFVTSDRKYDSFPEPSGKEEKTHPAAQPVFEKLQRLFEGLDHPLRLKILLALKDHGPMPVNNICHLVGKPSPYVSPELQRLLKLELVRFEAKGTSRIYWLTSNDHLHNLLDWVNLCIVQSV